MMTRTRTHAIISGRVQGVFFRHYTQLKARELGLVGWVNNNSDGTVTCVVEGESIRVREMVNWLHTGSPGARVSGVTVSEETCTQKESDFSIRY